MKKKVLQFYVLLFVLIVLLSILHFFYFGGLTGYSVLNKVSGGNSFVEDSNNFGEKRNEDGKYFYWTTIGIVAFLVLMFVSRFISEHYKKTRKMQCFKSGGERHLIELDLS